jgi:imidazolonepropionase-like amidohydrolase
MGDGDYRALPKVSFVKRLVRLIENGDEDDHMSFCDHCEGQRFDRAQVLRALRATRKRLRKANTTPSADQTIALAIEAVRTLEIPHLEPADELVDGEVVH